MIKSFPMSQVKINDDYLKNAFLKETEYLKSFDCDKLLSFFRVTKGIPPKAECYQGWENSEIRGHSLGHYITALSQVYSTTKDSTIYERLQYILDELSLCQFDSGYLSAFPEEFFDRVENRQPVWVPWYTMHKIIAGLVCTYNLTKIKTAYDIVSKLGDWVYKRSSKWTPETQAKVLAVEYGGMNDCMYELFKITKNENHRSAAHKFDEYELFKEIHDGHDILNNRHANTTIPKFLGALNRYLVYGEKEQFYFEACVKFWDIVVQNHSYATGGNSEWEHFGEPNILDAERTSTNCETCNTYNMLKLTRELYQITGDKKYSDFYENTFINAILSSQNPDTGMTMYFQPMATGYFKVYSSPFDHFWCCTGTGMENFSKLNDSIYFYDNNKIIVNMYISSYVNWAENNIVITQTSNIPNSNNATFEINTNCHSECHSDCNSQKELAISFRIPSWSKSIKIKINEQAVSFKEENGYAIVNSIFNNKDLIDISFDIEASLSDLPDNHNAVAFTYGPLVLSAGLGNKKMEESTTGVAVQIPTKHLEIKDYIIVKGQSVGDWKKHVKDNLIKTEGKLEFRLKGTDEDTNLIFTPHYKQHGQRYGIYWNLVEENSEELNSYIMEKHHKEILKAAEIDAIQIGNDQYELSHQVNGEHTESGDRDGYHYRFAKSNGWFSYNMKVSATENTYLQISFMPADCKNNFDLLVNDSLIAHQSIDNIPWNNVAVKSYLIPKELTCNGQIVVKFCASESENSARIIDVIRTTKEI